MGVSLSLLPRTRIHPTVEGWDVENPRAPPWGTRPSAGCSSPTSQRVSRGWPQASSLCRAPHSFLCAVTRCVFIECLLNAGHSWDPCSSERPRAAWGHGRLFLTVRAGLGLREGGVVGRGVQVVGLSSILPEGIGDLGENGGMLAGVGVFVSPQGLLGWLSSPRALGIFLRTVQCYGPPGFSVDGVSSLRPSPGYESPERCRVSPEF